MKYKISLHHDEEGVSVSVPGLPGCWSQGATEVEAINNIADAIREYLAAREDLTRGTRAIAGSSVTRSSARRSCFSARIRVVYACTVSHSRSRRAHRSGGRGVPSQRRAILRCVGNSRSVVNGTPWPASNVGWRGLGPRFYLTRSP